MGAVFFGDPGSTLWCCFQWGRWNRLQNESSTIGVNMFGSNGKPKLPSPCGLQKAPNHDKAAISPTRLSDLVQWTSMAERASDDIPQIPRVVYSDKTQSGADSSAVPAGTVMVVDDDVLVNGLTSQLLQRYGYAVHTVFSGEEALGLYKEKQASFDLIMLDLSMPGMGGYDCLRELVRFDPSVRVIVTSGYSDDEKKQETLQAGAAGFVGKPFRMADLINAVSSVLNNGQDKKG